MVYFQLSQIHSLAAKRLAEFSYAKVPNVVVRSRASCGSDWRRAITHLNERTYNNPTVPIVPGTDQRDPATLTLSQNLAVES